MKKLSALLIALLAVCPLAGAKITLPSLLGDGMVLQRNAQVRLWGTTDRSAAVRVRTSWDGRQYKVTPAPDGAWSVTVSTPEAGGPYCVDISDGETLSLRDVLIGEV